jgi:hypothetical protein
VIDQDAEGRVTNRFLVTASGSAIGTRAMRHVDVGTQVGAVSHRIGYGTLS